MKRIVTITGQKNCKKEFLVADICKEDGIQYVKPYTDRELPPNSDEMDADMYNYVLPTVMEDMIRDEDVLCETKVNGHRYLIFAFQMTAQVNVVYADDYAVVQIKDNWDDVYTVRVVNDAERPSDRVGEYLYPHEFDKVFDYDKDDVAELVELVL